MNASELLKQVELVGLEVQRVEMWLGAPGETDAQRINMAVMPLQRLGRMLDDLERDLRSEILAG